MNDTKQLRKERKEKQTKKKKKNGTRKQTQKKKFSLDVNVHQIVLQK